MSSVQESHTNACYSENGSVLNPLIFILTHSITNSILAREQIEKQMYWS
jgi:hypothetical protein